MISTQSLFLSVASAFTYHSYKFLQGLSTGVYKLRQFMKRSEGLNDLRMSSPTASTPLVVDCDPRYGHINYRKLLIGSHCFFTAQLTALYCRDVLEGSEIGEGTGSETYVRADEESHYEAVDGARSLWPPTACHPPQTMAAPG